MVGNVVATQKNEKLEGAKLMLVQPLTLDGKPKGPVVLTLRFPFWLSWYQRCPALGSMRAYMPSPPLRSCHIAGPGLPAQTKTEEPLSWAPALIPGVADVAKSAVMSPE